MRGQWVRRSRHWIANRGWGGFLREVWRRVGLVLRRKRRVGDPKAAMRAMHPFDERYGVETGGLVHGEELGTEAPEQYWATAYYGIAPSVFRQAMDRLGDGVLGGATFVDVGCGKGRAMMLAMEREFEEVVGVELSPGLSAVARKNLATYAEGRLGEGRVVPRWEVRCGDATAVELPEGRLVLWVYHPFAAPVMRRFLENVERQLRVEPREVWMVYSNPEVHGLVAGQPWLAVQWEEFFGMSGEDREADRFGSEWERMVAYRTMKGAAAL